MSDPSKVTVTIPATCSCTRYSTCDECQPEITSLQTYLYGTKPNKVRDWVASTAWTDARPYEGKLSRGSVWPKGERGPFLCHGSTVGELEGK